MKTSLWSDKDRSNNNIYRGFIEKLSWDRGSLSYNARGGGVELYAIIV